MTRARAVIDVLVLGAGVAGVTAARALSAAGHTVVVVEGRQRIGGRVHSIRDFCERPVEAVYASGLRAAGEVRAQLATRAIFADRRSPVSIRPALATSG